MKDEGEGETLPPFSLYYLSEQTVFTPIGAKTVHLVRDTLRPV